MQVYVDEDILLEVLKARFWEQEWADYGQELDALYHDLLARNPELQVLLDKAEAELQEFFKDQEVDE